LRCASPASISSHAVNFSGLILDSRLTRIVKSIARYSPRLVCLCGPSPISQALPSSKKTRSHRNRITTDQNRNSESILKQVWRNKGKSPRLRCLAS